MDQDRNGQVSDVPGIASDIRFATDHGLLTVQDGRMFQRGQEAFCRALATAAARQQDVRAAQVDLGSSTFRLEFTPGEVSEQEMAGRFAAAMRDALAEQKRAGQTDGHAGDWAALAAFPAGRAVSSWEIVRESADCLKLRNAMLRHDSDLAWRTAKELRKSSGILSAGRADRAVSHGDQLLSDSIVTAPEPKADAIPVSWANPGGLAILARAECLEQGQADRRDPGRRLPDDCFGSASAEPAALDIRDLWPQRLWDLADSHHQRAARGFRGERARARNGVKSDGVARPW